MDKKIILTLIIRQLEDNLKTLQHAANATHERSTHTETKAENKYDTFGLEASYLAHGQSVRVQEVEQAIAVFRTLSRTLGLSEFDDNTPIGQTALVSLETEKGDISWVWLASEAGGVKVDYQGTEITLVTPKSPLGKQLVGKYQDDSFNLNIGINNNNTLVEYTIISVT